MPVSKAFAFSYDLQGSDIYLHWRMPEGYYLYKDKTSVVQDEAVDASGLRFISTPDEVSDDIFGDVEVFYGQAQAILPLDPDFQGDLNVSLTFQGCAAGLLCYPPQTVSFPVSVEDKDQSSGLDSIVTDGLYVEEGETTVDKENLASEKASLPSSYYPPGARDALSSSGFALTVGVFFAIGLLLTFTPCVLPMIPVISSIIIGSEGKFGSGRAFRLSLGYVVGMVFVYTGLGLMAGGLGAEWNLQAEMQKPWVLGLIAMLFFALALSMFDVYQIRLPESLMGFVASKGKGGSMPGAVILGALSALAVSPCVTAPLAGTLTYLSVTGDYLLSGAALFAMSIGMGVPLILIATLGREFIPTSGEWMMQVKYFFGFLLLGTGIWMLSRVLPNNVTMFLYGALGIGFSIFLFELKKVLRHFQSLVLTAGYIMLFWSFFVFAGSAAGLRSASLSAPLKGFISEAPSEQVNLFEVVDNKKDLLELVGDGKPVMVDVYADWCVSCQIMDNEIFDKQEVRDLSDTLRFVKFDMTDFNRGHKEFLNENALIGPPALIFYYPNGDVIDEATLAGEVTLEVFLSHIKNNVRPFIDQN